MKQLREYIKKEIKTLMELKFPAPPEILNVLQNVLKLKPLVRYITKLKAINDLNKSYEVFLNNDKSFIISYLGDLENNFKVKISNKEYDILDRNQLLLALDSLNDLLKAPITKKGEGGDTQMDEPPAEEPEEPAEEPEA